MVVVDGFVRARPTERLQSMVAWYSGYRQVGVPPTTHRGLPSPYLTLIFTLDEPLVLAQHVDPRRAPGKYPTLLGGLHTSPALVRHDGRQSGIQVAVDPLAARSLFGLPAGELAGLDDEASAILGDARVHSIRDRLQVACTWAERFNVLDSALSDLVRTQDSIAPEVSYAWNRLHRTDGRIPVGRLAAETGWSARHLQSQLRLETGVTPKEAARVFRFDRARRRYACEPTRNLAALVAEHGYYDQAHLNREFSALAGCSPSAWWAEEFRNIQDGHWSPAADSSP